MATLREPVTVEELDAHIINIKANGRPAALEYYEFMESKGDPYASWGQGVANDDTFTGKAANYYNSISSRFGVGDPPSRIITAEDSAQINIDMALGNAREMRKQAKDSGGSTNKGLPFTPTERFHTEDFEKNDLSIQNWTLAVPMEAYKRNYGEAATEELWQKINKTEGTGLPAVWESTKLYGHTLKDFVKIDNDANLKLREAQWLAITGLSGAGAGIEMGSKYLTLTLIIQFALGAVAVNRVKSLLGSMFDEPEISGSQQNQLMAISKTPSFNYTSHKKDSVAGYNLYQMLDNAEDTISSSTMNGFTVYVMGKTIQPTCMGDEAGIGGGVKSGTVGKEVRATSGAPSILYCGYLSIRAGDTCTMNNENVEGEYISLC